MRRCIIEKLHYERMPVERLLDDAALHSCSSSVDDAHFAKTGSVSLGQVLCDDRGDITRCERVQVEHSVDRNPDRVLILHVTARPVSRNERSPRS